MDLRPVVSPVIVALSLSSFLFTSNSISFHQVLTNLVYETMGSISITANDALSQARQRFVERNPKSNALHHEAVAYLPGGNSRSVLHTAPFPISMTSGRSCYLVDEDGHE